MRAEAPVESRFCLYQIVGGTVTQVDRPPHRMRARKSGRSVGDNWRSTVQLGSYGKPEVANLDDLSL